jgi:hypothetical protein
MELYGRAADRLSWHSEKKSGGRCVGAPDSLAAQKEEKKKGKKTKSD